MKPVVPEPRSEAAVVVWAKDQPEYLPLPANVDSQHTETKWRLDWKERLHILFCGTLYMTTRNFGSPLQPIRLSVLRDDYIGGGTGCKLSFIERMRGLWNLTLDRFAVKL